MANYLVLDDERIRRFASSIVREITVKGDLPDYIAGVTRGGLVPANLLSQYFGVPLITINWSLRDNPAEDMAAIEHISDLLGQGKRVLLVDDICDEGDTLNAIWEHIYVNQPEAIERLFPSAVLVHNLGGKLFNPDYVGLEINKEVENVWVEFPWENWWLA